MKQQQIILQALRQSGNKGLNSYYATFTLRVKQAPTRISELKQLGHTIVARTNPDRSVNWVLIGSRPRVAKPEVAHNVEYVFRNGTAYVKEAPRQEQLL